jgi:hypothetical protein
MQWHGEDIGISFPEAIKLANYSSIAYGGVHSPCEDGRYLDKTDEMMSG